MNNIINFFGESLKKIDENEFSKIILPQKTESFLKKVGLPNNSPLIKFKPYDKFYLSKDGRFINIGDDYATNICIVKENEKILSVDDRSELPIRFVNTNIEFLLKFLIIYIENQKRLIEATDEEVSIILDEIKTLFNSIDSEALINEENWWYVILDQIEEELM